MNYIVLDANVAIDWCIPSPEGAIYSAKLAELSDSGEVEFLVPEHFHAEVSRILVLRGIEGKKPFGKQWLHEVSSLLDQTPITAVGSGLNFTQIAHLAEAFDLSGADVPYFHLARFNELSIETRDNRLIRSCNAWNVEHWQP